MNVILITICSNNYLAHTQTMLTSFSKYNSVKKIIAFLADEFNPSIDYSSFSEFDLIHYSDTDSGFYDDMKLIYTAYEFANALKPFLIEYIFNKYGTNNIVICLDSDIFITSSFENLILKLNTYDILLTPHFVNPSSPALDQSIALWHGDYNLGFIAVRHSDESINCIRWLQSRCIKYAKADKRNGFFGEQKWMNLAPIFFSNILILKDVGFNVAWWNLSERKIFFYNGHFYVNNLENKLIFFHFSGFNPLDVNTFGLPYDYVMYLDNYPDLKKLFSTYADILNSNNYLFFKEILHSIEVHGKDLKNVQWGIINTEKKIIKRKTILQRIYNRVIKYK
jgi:hypothetical protein